MSVNLKGDHNIVFTLDLPIRDKINKLKSKTMTLAEIVLTNCPNIFHLCINTLIKFSN